MSEPSSDPGDIEIDDGGEAAPEPGGASTSLGVVGVAPGSDQVHHIPDRYLIVVTVRDRAGSPVAHAPVSVLVDERPQPTRTTDATGLLHPPIEVAPRHKVEVFACFPPAPSDAEPPPGSLRITRDRRIMSVTTLAQLAKLGKPHVEGSLPFWPEAKDRIVGVVHLPLRPHCRYQPKHLFPWQNKILRDLIYRSDPNGPVDAGRRGSGASQDANEAKDRKQRLRDFIAYYRQQLRKAQPIADFLQSSREKFEPNPELADAYKQVADARTIERDLLRIDRRMDFIKLTYGHGNWGEPVLGPPAEVSESPEEMSEASPEEPLPDPEIDVAAGQLTKDDETKSGAPKQTRIDTSKRNLELRTLGRRRRELLREAKKAGVAEGVIDAAELRELKHRELLQYICGELFKADPNASVIPPWVRYAVLHYSGLRYAGAHNTYHPAEWIVKAIRLDEIQSGATDTTADPQRLAIFLCEHMALLRDDTELAEGLLTAGARRRRAKLRAEGKEVGEPVRAALEQALATLGSAAGAAAATGKNAPPSAADTLRAIVLGCAEHWTNEMDNEEQSRRARAEAVDDEPPPPPLPLQDAWGLLVWYRDTGKLPAAAWPAVVQYTELRNDFVNVPAVAFPPPPKPPPKNKPAPPAKGGGAPPTPAVPVAPVAGSAPAADPAAAAESAPATAEGAATAGGKWPVMAPSSGGRAGREYPGFASLFVGYDAMRTWKKKQARYLSLVVSRAVCNEISEMVGAARGVHLEGGITADAGARLATVDAGTNVSESVAPDAGDAADAAAADKPQPMVDMRWLFDLGGSLIRPTAMSQLKPGDLIFFLTWRPIGSEDEPWSIVSLRTPMDFHVALYADDDPLPGTVEKGSKRPPPRTISLRRSEDADGIKFVDDDHPDQEVPQMDQMPIDGLLRGKKGRPQVVDIPGEEARNYGARHTGVQQLAIARTSFAARHTKFTHMLVRRHPLVNDYQEVLAWSHIATVIHVPKTGNQYLAFETNDPTGVSRRTCAWTWNVVYGRPARQAANLPHLAHYLDPDNLLAEARLPKAEDK